MIKNKKCLVFGGAGSIGSELCRQLAPYNEVFVFDIDETRTFDLMEELKIKGRIGDVRDMETIEDTINNFPAHYTFICSAYKHVSPMQETPIEAIRTNILGTYNILNYSRKHGLRNLIFISTDKVNSDSIMGATKKVAEILTRIMEYTVVRFGNVLGSRGSLIPIWQKQLEQRKPLTVTDERMERFFMTIEEAVSLVIEAAEISQGGETICLDMGPRIKIIDLAKRILNEARQPDNQIEIIGTKPGEVFIEHLMSEEEEKRAIKQGRLWIIK